VSEVAVLKVVSPTIDGPNVALVIRFEHEGQERFARWIGEKDWREPASLERLFETWIRSHALKRKRIRETLSYRATSSGLCTYRWILLEAGAYYWRENLKVPGLRLI
jgi:hypothetical protein